MAKLYFYYSAMNAGKTTVLLQSAYNYRERGMTPLLFTPQLDDRYRVGTVRSRIGLEAENWSLTGWARNLTDQEYLEEVIPAPEFGGSFLHQAAESQWGIDFEYRF